MIYNMRSDRLIQPAYLSSTIYFFKLIGQFEQPQAHCPMFFFNW